MAKDKPLVGDGDLTYAAIGKAMEVHREVGPGLQEPLYHRILSEKLMDAELWHHSQPRAPLMHRGLRADEFEADLLFDDQLIMELKVLNKGFTPDHYTQLLCYQKFWSVRIGLLVDFGKESLRYKRTVFDDRTPPLPSVESLMQDAPAVVSDQALLTVIWTSIHRIYSLHGLGYRDTTYRGLLAADFSADAVPHRTCPEVDVQAMDKSFGRAKLNCIEVDHTCAVMTLALRETIRAADRAVVQTYLKLLDVPWGLILNFGKQQLTWQYVVI